jgi:FKBP-type peptidyl-prolyl cis-trans isomerase SlyD
MTIIEPCVVGLTWQLADAQGEPIDALEEPRIEEAIAGHGVGFEVALQLEPEQAFGEYDPSLVFFEERRRLPEDIAAGMQFDGVPEGATTSGMPEDVIYTVTEVYPEHVVLDGNHPLAGIGLRIRVQVRSVRAATDEEIKAGTVGPLVLSVRPPAPPGTALH